jgi:thiol-disulfide isomerase/thioredoxin
MKNNKRLLLLLPLLATLAVRAQDSVTVKGYTTQDTKGYNKVFLYIFGNNRRTDSATIKNGAFQFVVPFAKPEAMSFVSEYSMKVTKGNKQYELLIDKPGTVVMHQVDLVWGIHPESVSGIKSAEDNQYFLHNDPYTTEVSDIETKTYPRVPSKTDSRYADYKKSHDSLLRAAAPSAARFFDTFMNSHSSELIAVVALNHRLPMIPFDTLEFYYKRLSPNIRGSAYAKSLTDYINRTKKNNDIAGNLVGSYVQDFQLQDANGKVINFSALKGKYVMIDFWASWCAPCIASIPGMKTMYEKYKSDRFETLSISIDNDKSAWLRELAKQHLPWRQAWDDQDINRRQFAVKEIPAVFLVDPDGKIIVKAADGNEAKNNPILAQLIKIFGDKGLVEKAAN